MENNHSASAGDTSVFNQADLLDTFMEDSEKAKSLLSQFIERTIRQLEELPRLTEAKNWQEAHRLAHTIKGAAKMLAGEELGNAAEQLERAYKKAELPEVEAALPLVVKAFERFKSAAKEFLA